MKHTTITALASLLVLTTATTVLTACFGGNPSESSTPTSSAVSEQSEETSHTTTTHADTDLPETVWVVADQLTVSSAAGLGNSVIGGLQYGDRVAVLGREGDWLKIDFAGTEGYISRQYIQYTDPSVDPPTTTQELVNTTAIPTATAPISDEISEGGSGESAADGESAVDGESGDNGESDADGESGDVADESATFKDEQP